MDWQARILRAIDTGGFSSSDRQLARSWMTCAVGEKHTQEPQIVVFSSNPHYNNHNNPTPIDNTLSGLGTNFYYKVSNDEPTEALVLYARIQERIKKLKTNATRRKTKAKAVWASSDRYGSGKS